MHILFSKKFNFANGVSAFSFWFKIDQSEQQCVTEHSWGSFPNGEKGYEELEAPAAYRIALKTWANWVDTNVNPNKTRVFFTTMSPTHMRYLSHTQLVMITHKIKIMQGMFLQMT